MKLHETESSEGYAPVCTWAVVGDWVEFGPSTRTRGGLAAGAKPPQPVPRRAPFGGDDDLLEPNRRGPAARLPGRGPARRTLLSIRLNAPEAVALIADEMHFAARAGKRYDEVVAVGMNALSEEQVMDGVADIVTKSVSRCCSRKGAASSSCRTRLVTAAAQPRASVQ